MGSRSELRWEYPVNGPPAYVVVAKTPQIEHRELMNRGVDPTQGWMVNAQKWKEVTMVAPTVAPAMGR
nr:protein PLANT CADMIUM RESISTANCE 7-like [Ipomoea trifida]